MSTLGFDSDVGVDVVRLIRGTVVWGLWKDAIRRRWEVHGQAGAGVLWKRRVEVLCGDLGRPQPADAQDSEGTARVGGRTLGVREQALGCAGWMWPVGWTLHYRRPTWLRPASDFTWLFQPPKAVPRSPHLLSSKSSLRRTLPLSKLESSSVGPPTKERVTQVRLRGRPLDWMRNAKWVFDICYCDTDSVDSSREA